MNEMEARNIGKIQSILAMILCFGFVELKAMIAETHGDFANGILFFLAARINSVYLSLLVFLFLVPALLGSRAGQEILIQRKHFLLATLKYGAVVTLILAGYQYFRAARLYPDEPMELNILIMPVLFGIAYAGASGILIRRHKPKDTATLP